MEDQFDSKKPEKQMDVAPIVTIQVATEKLAEVSEVETHAKIGFLGLPFQKVAKERPKRTDSKSTAIDNIKGAKP